ncbi:hypothetical protein AB0R12_34980, partial [Streptomyces niveus]|uniref:hypothetical protein n=1 Tax=Streptomyces niveus TaxID=193462 RepID=UPI0034385BFE
TLGGIVVLGGAGVYAVLRRNRLRKEERDRQAYSYTYCSYVVETGPFDSIRPADPVDPVLAG